MRNVSKERRSSRFVRHRRVRKKSFGTSERPRLNVFRSHKHIYAQLIDDVAGVTLTSVSTLSPEVRSKLKDDMKKTERSKLVGKALAEKALNNGITTVTFDRGGYLYHGRVKALADGAREGGLKF